MILLRIILCLFCISGFSSAFALEELSVAAEIEESRAVANQPLEGTITITHTEKEPVDTSSFKLENKPLTVEFVKSVKLSPISPLQLSIYQFEIPGKSQGLYILPEISVKLGNKVYKSIARSYEVKGVKSTTSPKTTASTETVSTKPSNAELKLKAAAEAHDPLYVGQRFRLVYHFYFKGDIELLKEELPLLDATGLEKIGDKVIKDYHEGDWSVQEVSQLVRANKPGNYSFPESLIEGFGYTENKYSKKRSYLHPRLQAKADPLVVKVYGFPSQDKPPFFNGAVGHFGFHVSLITPSRLALEEKMQLAIDISSQDANLEDVKLPSLNQPEIRGLFRVGDLPPTGEISKRTKRFIVELYPLSTSIKEIPPLAFSFFDPTEKKYVTLKSQPIPITVFDRRQTQPPKDPPKEPAKQPVTPTRPVEEKPATIAPVQPIEIAGNIEIIEKDLYNLPFGSWKVLWVIPLAFLLFLAEMVLQKYYLEKKLQKPHESEVVWQSAMKKPKDSPESLSLINRALMLKLFEEGFIPSADLPASELSSEGISGAVKHFIVRSEEMRFTGKKEGSVEQMLSEAKALKSRIKEEARINNVT